MNLRHYRFIHALARGRIRTIFRFSARDERLLISYLDWLQRFELSHGLTLDDHPYSMLASLQKSPRALLLEAIRRSTPEPIKFIYRLVRKVFRLFIRILGLLRLRIRKAILGLIALPAAWSSSKWRVRHPYLYSRKAAYDRLTKNGELEGAIEAFPQLAKLHSTQEPQYAALDRLMVGLVRKVFRTPIRILELLRLRIRKATLGLIALPAAWFSSKWRVRHLYFYSRKAAYDLLTKNGELEGAIEAFTRLAKLHSTPEPQYAALDRLMVRLLPQVARIEGAIARADLPQRRTGERWLVIGAVLWGDRYIGLFEKYCLPSLLAEGNIPAVSRDVHICWHIITTSEGRKRLSEGDFWRRLAGLCEVRYDEIPPDLINLAGGDNRYWLYGALSNTSFRLAARLEADIHFLNPDVVYSKSYLSSLYRLEREEAARVILTNSFRTTLETVCPALDARKDPEDVLSLDADVLHGLGLQHLHTASRKAFLRESEVAEAVVPRSTLFFWLEAGHIVCHTAHYTPVFISHTLLGPKMKLPYFTVDSSILHILGDGSDTDSIVYIPQPEDGIGYFEVSAASAFRTDKVSLERLAELFWETNTLSELGLLAKEMRLPIGDTAPPVPLGSQSPSSSRQAFQQILGAIEAARPRADMAKLAALDAMRSYTLFDLVVRTDVLMGFEVRNGCIPEVETLLEDVRNIIGQGRTIYTGTQVELDVLARVCVNFLRLGLFDELLQLIRRHRLPISDEMRAFTDYCAATFPEYLRLGKEYRDKYRDSDIFVMGCIVWGDEYIDNFMHYNVRSMLSPGNLPALRRQGRVVFSIVTNRAGEQRVRANPIFGELSGIADIQFLIAPDLLIQILTAGHLAGTFYVMYGLLDHSSIFFAQGMNAHLFMIPVDSVVAEGSLANMANYRHDGYECCGGGNIVAETETFLPALDRRFVGARAISISTEELATLAVQHAHHYFRSQVIAAENKDFGRHPRELFWPVEGGVEIHSVFIHPLFTASSALARYRRMHFANIDYGMIPRIFSESSRIKIIEDPRQAYINNFASGKRLYETTGNAFTVEDFLRAHDYSYPVQRSLFQRPQLLPCRLLGWTGYRDVEKDVEDISAALGFQVKAGLIQAVA